MMSADPIRSRSSRAALAFAALAAGALALRAGRAETLTVPTDFPTIQAAIDAARANDLVLVEPGRYEENLSLRTGVDVAGRETARTLLAPADDTLAAVTIASVIGVRFTNFTLVDAGVGVAVSGSSGIDVANLVFDGSTGTGLVTDVASSVQASNDVFYRNARAVARGSAATELYNDIFSGNEMTIATALSLQDPYEGVRADCFFDNADLSSSGIDMGAGAGAVVGAPRFVDAAALDFHLREGSVCIDIGRGMDVIDETPADAGAYGGPFADPYPYPVPKPMLKGASGGRPAGHDVEVDWQPNLSYRVTNSTHPGGYRVYYVRGGAPPDDVPSAYTGMDAGAGELPSPVDVGDVTTYTLMELSPRPTAPLAPRLASAAGRDGAAVLAWGAAAGATGYRVYFGEADVSEHSVDVGDVTAYTVQGLTNGIAYRFAVSALDQAGYAVAVSVLDDTQNRHESALSPPATIAVGEPAESPLSQPLTATPSKVVPYPDLPDSSRCFIATAAFGAGWAPEVLALRDFRDRFLLASGPGRWLVATYYALGPPAARFLNAHAYLKPVVRAALWPLVIVALAMLEGSAAAWAALLLLAGAELALRIRVRRYARSAGSGAHGRSARSAGSAGSAASARSAGPAGPAGPGARAARHAGSAGALRASPRGAGR